MKEQNSTLIETVSAARELRNVPGFDPRKFLRRTVAKTGETALKLDLPYKRLWFRLACPEGRMLLNPLRITDQMAIFEARLYSGRDDASLISSFTSTQLASDGPGGQYIRTAQDEALDTALDNAGFGIQLCEMPNSGGAKASQEQSGPETVVEVSEIVSPAPEPVKAQPPTEPAKPTKAVTTPPAQEAAPQAASRVISMPAHEEPSAPVAEPASAPVTEASAPQPVSAAPAAEEASQEPPHYTADMTVEEIRALMTLEDAKKVEVPIGSCKGMTLGQVAEERKASLKWYLYAKTDNIVKAGAAMLLEELGLKKAG